ncbi:MAG: PQQ-binding-like beta-propeller repeat protein [Alphaproteobacteria bacterium]|nr:PQQ-binding-like beta-propeller repeat protein [Alphaproteobacteria bacterium]MBQ9235265.1 PQQ-binding-like beta-propeller repeat protein [Alphaproteobacteria bacterium]
MKKIVYGCLLTALLTGCGLFSKDPLNIDGERISVIREDKNLQPEYAAGQIKIRLPKAALNDQWNQSGGNALHALGHIKAGGDLDEIWDVSFGAGSSKRNVLITSPVSDGSRVYTLDANGIARAYRLGSGEEVWRRRLKHANRQNRDSSLIGAGLAVHQEKVFATTGFGKVFAILAADGEIIWQTDLKSPIRIAPCVADDLAIVQTIDNAIYALRINDGSILWKDKIEAEATTMIGGAAPAYDVANDLVVAAFSNGQVQAYKASTGTPLWSEWVISGGATEAIAELTSVKANPVIDNGIAYIAGYNGPLTAIDIRTGVKLWIKDIAVSSQPWVAGQFLFVLTNDGDLAALERTTGKVVWSTIIPYAKGDERLGVFTSGPVLTNDALLVVSSNGKLFSVSPYNGRIMGIADVEKDVETSPIMVDGTLLLTTKNARLNAYK